MRANKPILRVSQNAESFDSFLSGMMGMYESLSSLNKKEIKDRRAALDPALAAAAQEYANVIERVIDYEAGMHATQGDGFSSVFRHLYEGGNPMNMGNKGKRLFNVTYKKIAEGRGLGYEIVVNTRADSAPATSSVTGSDRKIEVVQGEMMFGGPYPNWADRAASVYSKYVGSTQSGMSSGSAKNQYLVYAEPEPQHYTTTPPDFVVSSESFSTDYVAYKRMFHNWWERQMRVTGQELLNVLDTSAGNAITKGLATNYRQARAKEGKAAVKTRANVVMPGTPGGRKTLDINEIDEQVATLVGRKFAKAFADAVNYNKHKIKEISGQPTGPVDDKPKVKGVETKIKETRDWMAEQEAADQRFLKKG